MLHYELTDTGYVIYRNGDVLITQEFVPGVPGVVEFANDEAKQNYAEAAIAELTPAAAPVEQAQ